MGNETSKFAVNFRGRDYFFGREVGKGNFGKVLALHDETFKHYCCVKVQDKEMVANKGYSLSILRGVKLSYELQGEPFVACCYQTWQTERELYTLTDLFRGGDLRFHLSALQRFPHAVVKFFAACLLLGLQSMAARRIVHRDIKVCLFVLRFLFVLFFVFFGKH
jgi:beta-adrenergic-receptor kinase